MHIPNYCKTVANSTNRLFARQNNHTINMSDHAVSGFSVILNGHGELRTLSLDVDCFMDFDITEKKIHNIKLGDGLGATEIGIGLNDLNKTKR